MKKYSRLLLVLLLLTVAGDVSAMPPAPGWFVATTQWYAETATPRYVLIEDISTQSGILGQSYTGPCIVLDEDGVLTLRAGFAWNGPSWVPEFRELIRASSFHDALYRLLRAHKIPMKHRKEADLLFARIAREENFATPNAARRAVRAFGRIAARLPPRTGELECKPFGVCP